MESSVPGQIKTFSSGSRNRMDALVTVSRAGTSEPGREAEVKIESSVRKLFAESQDETVASVLESLSDIGLKILIEDNQAFNFTLRARLVASVEALIEWEDEN